MNKANVNGITLHVSPTSTRIVIDPNDGGPLITAWCYNRSWNVRGEQIGCETGPYGLTSYLNTRCPEYRKYHFNRCIEQYINTHHLYDTDYSMSENMLLAGMGYPRIGNDYQEHKIKFNK
jgi:hypothetical protein